MPDAVLIHSDRTECHHDGPPLAVIGEDGGPLCPDGRPIAAVQYGAVELGIDAAYSSIASVARGVFQAISAAQTVAIIRACARVSADPAVAALAAAAQVVDTARAAEAQAETGEPARSWPQQRAREAGGDPCGPGPI